MARVSTRARAELMSAAVEALVWVLGEDPRVQQAYVGWRAAHRLHGVVAFDAFRAALVHERPEDRVRLERLVFDDLQLSYGWLPTLLLMDFRVMVVGQATSTTLGLQVRPDDKRLSGRRAKSGGKHVLRDVWWFYRHRIKRPRETIHALAHEYARDAQRRTDARSVVQTGIRRAESLLNAFQDTVL